MIVKAVVKDITEFRELEGVEIPDRELENAEFLKITIYGELLYRKNGKVVIMPIKTSPHLSRDKDSVFLIPEELVETLTELIEVKK